MDTGSAEVTSAEVTNTTTGGWYKMYEIITCNAMVQGLQTNIPNINAPGLKDYRKILFCFFVYITFAL